MPGRKGKTTEQRFWEKVDIRGADECWNWKFCVDIRGYGKFQIGERVAEHAHRVAYRLTFGTFPLGKNNHICHSCDNPPCCNPAHLFFGTAKVNHADRDSKGRQANGEKNGNNKLTSEQVLEIRKLAEQRKFSQRELAKMFGIDRVSVQRILYRKAWKHI